MDIALGKEDLAFAERMRSFFRTEIPAEIRAKGERGEHVSREDFVTTQQILNAHGLAVPHWPVEWGGQDWTALQRHIWAEEMALAHVPPPLAFNAAMVGPVIATFGSEELKQRFLPPTANLDIWWCQGFSEPNAGSDLASLTTRAVRDGDTYVINGQKTWTTLAQWADWIFCLVRTDPEAKKQLGISFVLVDMKTPGVTVRPIRLIDGGYEVNEVFFDDVRIPADQLVGEENRGWDYGEVPARQRADRRRRNRHHQGQDRPAEEGRGRDHVARQAAARGPAVPGAADPARGRDDRAHHVGACACWPTRPSTRASPTRCRRC